MSRPLGITILAILGFIGSIFIVLGGIALIFLGPTLSMAIEEAYMVMPIFAALVGILGFVFVVMGFVGLVVNYGLWTGKSWAWWIFLILLVLSIVSSLFTLPQSIVGIAIDVIIIYYLTRRHVKEYFGIS